jgi:hypothetical protein
VKCVTRVRLSAQRIFLMMSPLGTQWAATSVFSSTCLFRIGRASEVEVLLERGADIHWTDEVRSKHLRQQCIRVTRWSDA